MPRPEMVAKTLSFSSYQPVKPPHTATVMYKECLKNHAASLGGHALDGCGEFMPLSSDRTDQNSMKCAACGCHRNFHRQDMTEVRREPPLPPPVIPTWAPHFSLLPRRFASFASISPSPSSSPPRHLDPPPPPPTAVASLQQYPPGSHMLMAISTRPLRPEHLNEKQTKTEASEQVHNHRKTRPNPNTNPNSNNNSSAKTKRFRSKFSREQKEKMRRFAEGLNWKMQRNDEKLVREFCEEVGLSKGVLKVWMHNNKNTVRKMANSNHSSSCNNEEDDNQINDQLGFIDHLHHQYDQHHNGSSCSA